MERETCTCCNVESAEKMNLWGQSSNDAVDVSKLFTVANLAKFKIGPRTNCLVALPNEIDTCMYCNCVLALLFFEKLNYKHHMASLSSSGDALS